MKTDITKSENVFEKIRAEFLKIEREFVSGRSAYKNIEREKISLRGGWGRGEKELTATYVSSTIKNRAGLPQPTRLRGRN